jgi:hypothetical protein
MSDPCIQLRRVLAVSVGLAVFYGCAEVSFNGSGDYPARRMLIGKTKQQLFACAGNPVGEKTQGDQVSIVYYKEASLLEESFPSSKGSFAMVHHGCRATVSLEQDRVRDVRYESVPSSYRDEDHCEEIFQLCTGP